MMKKIITLIFILTLMLTMSASVNAEDKVTVMLDGVEISFPDAQPFIDKRDRTLVPIRFVSEALGSQVSWDGANQTAIIVNGNDTITYKINEFRGYING